ncbi:MAG: OmpA family protein [Succinivibrionaceae bacterium]
MKKLMVLTLALFSASLYNTSNAAEPETGYIGIRGGWGHVEYPSSQRLSNVYSIDENNGFGGGLYTGYNFSKFFGLELGYDYFGKFSNLVGNAEHEYKVHGLSLATVVALPFNDNGDDLFVKLGALHSNIKDSFADSTQSKVSPLLGAGARVAFGDFLVRLEYDWSHKIATYDKFGYNPDLHYTSLGFEYKFGGKTPEPIVEAKPAAQTPQQEPKKEVISKTITLESSALFGYNSSKLSSKGKQSISKVTNEIKDNNIQDIKIKVEGHTDRIGSEKYNMELSKKRARSVVEEFISNGIEPSSITAEGYGESSPVTGHTCNKFKGKKLIECLAPDRRVEVKFNGLKTYTE